MTKFTFALLVFFFSLFALAPLAIAEEEGTSQAETTVKAEAKSTANTKTMKPTDRLGSAVPYSFFL